MGGVESDAPEVFLNNLEAAVCVPGGTGVLDPDGVLVLEIENSLSNKIQKVIKGKKIVNKDRKLYTNKVGFD